jgi:hypothetical protein
VLDLDQCRSAPIPHFVDPRTVCDPQSDEGQPMRDADNERFSRAVETAREAIGEKYWDQTDPSFRSSVIYHHLCRIDSGCKRTGGPADRALPPCRANDDFRNKRRCRLADNQKRP